MVRIARIAGVVALVLSGLVVVSLWAPIRPLRLGVSDNTKTKEFLNSPSAVKRYNDSRGVADSDGQDKTSPLVRQASALADIMRPRQEAAAQASAGSRGQAPPAPPVRSAKFDVVGISYSPSDPQACFAFIHVPADNSYQWIQPGSTVGHQTIKEIKGGSIICSDGSEIPVTAPANTASMLETGASPVAAAASGLPSPGVRPASFPGVRPPVPVTGGVPTSSAPADSGRLTEQDKEGMNELVNRLKQELQNKPGSGQADSNTAAGEQAAAVDKLISELKSSKSRVSPEEAQKLVNLGEQLNGATDKRANDKRRELMRRLYPNRPAQQ